MIDDERHCPANVYEMADDDASPSEAPGCGAEILAQTVLDLIQADPHQWSKRPCTTCQAVSTILKKPFGCVLHAKS